METPPLSRLWPSVVAQSLGAPPDLGRARGRRRSPVEEESSVVRCGAGRWVRRGEGTAQAGTVRVALAHRLLTCGTNFVTVLKP